MTEHIEDLRRALLALAPSGAAGFEGLLAATLSAITGFPFRLAGGGLQRGLDGSAAFERDAICFEGKLYDGALPRNEVVAKIADLTKDDKGDVDLWVLGATVAVRTQLVEDARALAGRIGVAVLVLDWSPTNLPPLAVSLAMAGEAAKSFLEQNVQDAELAGKAKTALSKIREDAAFASHAERIRAELSEPSIGTALARAANAQWLNEVFTNRQTAVHRLGQPLCPADAASRTIGRPALTGPLSAFLVGAPDRKVAIVLGEEGHGKSWVIGQAWLSLQDKPLMLFFAAEEFAANPASTNSISLLVAKLIAQTDGRTGLQGETRWQRKFERWRNRSNLDSPRFVVVIDGLNQRPELDWARIVDAMNYELTPLGGKLMVSTRSSYYVGWVKRRLDAGTVEIEVPQWSESERDQVLAGRGIRGIDLQPAVANSLRNPRLLGIALELLQRDLIQELHELSVSRLLFEHIRTHERDAPMQRTAQEFARRLADHAQEIRDRLAAQQRDDLSVFDGDLRTVADGRFFIPVVGDQTRYTISEDGLSLALGFAIIDALTRALRNGRNLNETFETTIEPLATLDRTAEIVLAALTIACLKEDCPPEVGVTIVRAFARLQNPSADAFPQFASLAGQQPTPFLEAAKQICLASSHEPNFDWIQLALHGAKEKDHVWTAFAPAISAWLSTHTLSLDRRLYPHLQGDGGNRRTEERARKEEQIRERLRELSASERELIGSLPTDDRGDLGRLARFAMTLIAGKPVAPFAKALRDWAFTQAVNPEPSRFEEFLHLVRFNPVDWAAAREAIVEAGKIFEQDDSSRSGKWALVRLLNSTGHNDDAVKAEALFEELSSGREFPRSTPRREDYCRTDPCDPESERPDNIAATAVRYSNIDAGEIRLGRGNSALDYFFVDARLGMARFERAVAVAKHRELIADIPRRTGLPLRQAVIESREHNALLTDELARALVPASPGVDSEESAFVPQFRLAAAFPLLSADEQARLLLSPLVGNNILVDLIEAEKPLTEDAFERLLKDACEREDELAQYKLVAVAERTDTPVSAAARAQLKALIGSPSARVRAQTFALIAQLSDDGLIGDFLVSGWRAAVSMDRFECWYGSAALTRAAENGRLSHQEAIDRMTPSFYGRAASRLDLAARRELARRTEASIRAAARLPTDIAAPHIELPSRKTNRDDPATFSLRDPPPDPSDVFSGLQRASESPEEFAGRQRRLEESFVAFQRELTQQNASVVLDELRIEEFDVIAASDPERADNWYTLLTDLPRSRHSPVHEIGMLLSHALAPRTPDKALDLFRLYQSGKPLVRRTFGMAGVTLDQLAIWSAQDGSDLDALRLARLDRAANDHELALEVLAALMSGKALLISQYIEGKLQTGRPADEARAVMTAGLSEHSEFNSSNLARYEGSAGFLGAAYRAAIFAYQRNAWSMHWFKVMCKTNDAEEFWSSSTLLSKIVDGRIDIWNWPAESEVGEPFRLFWPSVERQLRARINKWQAEREKKLFGEPAPAKIFLGALRSQ